MPKKREKKSKDILTPAKNVDADILVPRLVFIISTLVLILFGFVMVFSASNVEAIHNNLSPFHFLIRQVAFGSAGIIIALLIWRKAPFSWWRGNLIWWIFGFLSLGMLLTLVMGTDILGARRWIYLGSIGIQPAEYAKIVLVLLVAKYISDYYGGRLSWFKCLCIAGGLTVIMLAFILIAQSDLGTTIICVIGVLSVLFIIGVPTPVVGFFTIVCIILGVLAIVATGYRSNRMIFLDPYNDGAGGYGAGYQLIRSFYAFSEGGITGVGLGNSYEKYQYLPEAETDFIFSIVGEELGFIGCILVIIVFIVFLVSGLVIAMKSKSRFAAAISSAFVIMIVFQAFLNIMCVLGVAPTTGKPLPFISYGGSSLIATLIMVGFILAASESEALPDEYAKRRQEFKVSTSREKQVATSSKTSRKVSLPKFKVEIPKFISDNDRQRKTTRQRTTYVKKSVNTVKPRPSVKQSSTSSYVYKRSNSGISFKPSVSSSQNKSSRNNTTVRPSVKNMNNKKSNRKPKR